MKAMVYTKYGAPEVLHFTEVEQPTPKDDEVLIKVVAAALNAADWHLLRGDPFLFRMESGLSKPKRPILGADVAGRVEAVGKNVTQFKRGDAVYGDLSGSGLGGFAEFVCAPVGVLALKPASISFEQAAAVPMAAVTALQGLRDKGGIQRGQKVLINGASGGVGTFAVQIAKSFGAEVTAVCSTSKVDMIRALGADHVIDYTKVDFTRNGQCYDLILAANGYRTLSDYKRALAPNGTYVMTGGSMDQIFQALLLGSFHAMGTRKKFTNLSAKPKAADLLFMNGLLEAGTVVPVIDRQVPLAQLADALRYLEEGHAKGKIVIKVADSV